MENKTLAHLGLGIALLLLVGTFTMGRMNGRSVSSIENMADHRRGGQSDVSAAVNMDDHHKGNEQTTILSSEELAKYRSEDIPADCRLPDYDNNINEWKQHLSHHKQTEYCLDYYGTSIEELNRDK